MQVPVNSCRLEFTSWSGHTKDPVPWRLVFRVGLWDNDSAAAHTALRGGGHMQRIISHPLGLWHSVGTHPLSKTHNYHHCSVDHRKRTLQGDILFLLRLFSPLITTNDEGWVTASKQLIAVYWHRAVLRQEGKSRLACSSMNTLRVRDSRYLHSVHQATGIDANFFFP